VVEAKPFDISKRDVWEGVVTLSQVERNLPITANAEARGFNGLACCSIAEIRLILLNVTMPSRELTQSNRLAKITMWFCDRVLLNAQNMSGRSRNKEVS
jgi:hypothetical protein